MAIKLTRYVDITSGVGAGANVGTRRLIGRFFDDNDLIPTGSFVEFDSADDVATYFGSDSLEYARAAFYFGWVSKELQIPPAMQFARWVSSDTEARIYGARGDQSVDDWTGITSGNFGLTIGGVANSMAGLNFSSAVSLADVAQVIETAINAKTGTQWTAATVTWNATRKSFDFVSGDDVAATISVQEGTGGNDVADRLGWLSATAIISDGAVEQTIQEVLSESAAANNDFGSFTFTATLTQDQIEEAATWNDTQNNMFLYSVRCTSANASALSAALLDLSGVTLTLSPISTEYPEQVPMMIEAATDYTERNSTQNYMFQIFSLTPSVTTDADADVYDALRVNYYGQTQTAGQLIEFYQRGYMMGLASDALDQNTYVNEIWLKDAAGAAIMTLLLGLSKVPANKTGIALILNILQGVIDQALFNGSISVGKALTSVQKAYITNATGDPLAWKQVQNLGYWVSVRIETEVGPNNVTEYKAIYTLIYSKDDVIRKVEGRDILI
jgi:hypothetical protein